MYALISKEHTQLHEVCDEDLIRALHCIHAQEGLTNQLFVCVLVGVSGATVSDKTHDLMTYDECTAWLAFSQLSS